MGPGMQKRCTVPMFLGPGMQNAVLLQKTNLLRVSSSKIGTVRCFCFCVRMGQYSTSGLPGAENAVLSQCFWVQACKNAVLSQSFRLREAKMLYKVWDSTALQALQVQKTLYCPNVFGSRRAKTLYCPNVFGSRHAKTLYCPNLLGSEEQKRCTVPKTQKKQSFEGLQLKDWDNAVFLLLCPKKIWTVQHFRPSRCRKRCTVPIFLVQACKNAVLSQCFWVHACKNAVLSHSFRLRGAKTLYCPRKLKKTKSFEGLQLKDWDNTVFLLLCPRGIRTAQLFRPSRCKIRCPVPMFWGPGMQKRCTVPIFDLETLKRLVFFWDSTAFLLL